MLNCVTIQGRVCNDIELKETAGGHKVTSFAIASERDFKAEGAEREADFVNIVAWNYNAEFVKKYFEKGDMMVVIGRLQTRNYTDSSGNPRKSVEVIAEHIYFSGKKVSAVTAERTDRGYEEFVNVPDGVEDEFLPFN